MSGDAEHEYFADGVTEDIITDLSQVSALFVVARNTVFTYKGKAVEVTEAAQRLNVGYILHGSVRKAANRVRINVQLIDGATGDHVWSSGMTETSATSLRCRTRYPRTSLLPLR